MNSSRNINDYNYSESYERALADFSVSANEFYMFGFTLSRRLYTCYALNTCPLKTSKLDSP